MQPGRRYVTSDALELSVSLPYPGLTPGAAVILLSSKGVYTQPNSANFRSNSAASRVASELVLPSPTGQQTHYKQKAGEKREKKLETFPLAQEQGQVLVPALGKFTRLYL